jgi:hypothetical protein
VVSAGWLSHGAEVRRTALREHGLLLLIFIVERATLYAAGLRFNLDLSWMFLSDLPALRERLMETVFYFHAFAPGMNLLTGLLLKVAPDHTALLAACVFWTCGWLLSACLFQTLKLLGFRPWAALAISLAFSLLPQTLYLENLYLYTYLSASVLCLLGVLFYRALQRRSVNAWCCFFLPCAALGWLYTAFHLLWFGLMLGLAAALTPAGSRRRLLLGAAGPATLLLALYVKNYVVFGVFGATSWGGANLTLTTTQQMPASERKRWIREGKLSPYAAVSAYAPPSAYLKFFPTPPHFPWPGSNELTRPSLNSGNFNHGLFLEVNKRRGQDAAYFIKTRPGDYLRRVFTQNLPSLFHSTTHWHPLDRRPDSPHAAHRAVLGGYERLYDRLVHSWPVDGVGLYAFFPGFYAWALWHAFKRSRAADEHTRAAGALLGLCLLQIAYVTSVSSMATSWETSRYRYAIEPCIWIVVAMGLRAAYQSLRRWGPSLRRFSSSGTWARDEPAPRDQLRRS